MTDDKSLTPNAVLFDMSKILSIWLLPFLLILLSCSDKTGSGSKKVWAGRQTKILEDSGSFREYLASRDRITRAQLDSALKIAPFESETGGLQIRISKFSTWDNNNMMLFIKQEDSIYSGQLVKFSIDYSQLEDSMSLIATSVVGAKPQSSWRDILDSLRDLGIFVLRDCSKLKGYEVPSDCMKVVIEYNDHGNFRTYVYYCPQVNFKTIIEAKRIIQITNLLEREFGFSGFGFDFVNVNEP